MGKIRKTPSRLGEVLGHFLKSSGLKRRIEEQKVLDSWEKAVGVAVAERSQPVGVRNRVLQVKVSSSVWMQQLQFLKGLILEKLHEQTGNHFLQDLRFFLGEMESSDEEVKKKKEEEERGAPSPDLTEEERERIEKALSGVRDPEMREILSRIYSKGIVAGKNRGGK
jgi:predicted nucleic acid-binding Zn ribbon protein